MINANEPKEVLELRKKISEIEEKRRIAPYHINRESYFLGQHRFDERLGINHKDIDRINSILKKEVDSILEEKKKKIALNGRTRTAKHLVDMIISYAKMAEYKKSWKHKITLQEVEYTKSGLLPDQALQFDISWKQLNLEQYIIKQKGGSNDD